jgi:hypothetical protein
MSPTGQLPTKTHSSGNASRLPSTAISSPNSLAMTYEPGVGRDSKVRVVKEFVREMRKNQECCIPKAIGVSWMVARSSQIQHSNLRSLSANMRESLQNLLSDHGQRLQIRTRRRRGNRVRLFYQRAHPRQPCHTPASRRMHRQRRSRVKVI